MMLSEAQRWIRFAEEDLKVAELVFREGIYNQVCFAILTHYLACCQRVCPRKKMRDRPYRWRERFMRLSASISLKRDTMTGYNCRLIEEIFLHSIGVDHDENGFRRLTFVGPAFISHRDKLGIT